MCCFSSAVICRVHQRTTKLSEYASRSQCFIPPWSCSLGRDGKVCILLTVYIELHNLYIKFHSIYWVILQETQLNACQAEQRKPHQPFCFKEQLQKLWPSVGRERIPNLSSWLDGDWQYGENQANANKHSTLICLKITFTFYFNCVCVFILFV